MLTQKQASPFKNKSPSAMQQPEQRGCKCWQSITTIPLTSRVYTHLDIETLVEAINKI